ncbi:Ni/Fe hydrogenase subunit alpha [Alteromonas sp. CYL-A6]|uniref:Ni/Fe hydrogenase subunit alpha n=1 Tax=Alteromonas nitratireducens TaxID=3390813 RepID=UPI0034C471AC
MGNRKINLNVPFITRVEGEGALTLTASGNDIEKLHLQIFEPPRLFERFLVGKSYQEVPDLSARICGICPMAYQLTSILAMESLFEVTLPTCLQELRLLMNVGEWLQSHALHIHFLAMPDYYGFDSALQMAPHHPDLLKRGMQIQEAGNALMRLLGGRSVHPVGLQVGGFSTLPTPQAWEHARKQVNDAITAVNALFNWAAELTLPDYAHPFTSVSLSGEGTYPINGGAISIDGKALLRHEDYASHFKEHQVSHSTALYSLFDGQDYLVGPLARMNNNFSQLPEKVRAMATRAGVTFPSHNMFDSVRARALECVWALQTAQEILQQDCPVGDAHVPYTVTEGECCYCTEAPRGLIYHHYQIDDAGKVVSCRIIPPTSQNQARIEKDLKQALHRFGMDKADDDIKRFCEQVIRNYDPCISCSTHFLDLTVLRR